MSHLPTLRPVLAIAIVGAVLGLALPMAAQEASPPAASLPTDVTEEQPAVGDLTAVFPTELGGEPWDQLTINVGQEAFDARDEVNAEEAVLEALLEATGASIDDVTGLQAFTETEDGAAAFVTAVQVVGVDARQVWEQLFQPAFDESMIQPREETGQVGGKDVRIIWDDEYPDSPPAYIYLGGDTVWLIAATEPSLTELFDKIP